MEEMQYRTTSNDKKGNRQKELMSKFPVITESAYHLDRYKTAVEAIKEWIREPFDLGDLEEGVAGGIQDATAIEASQEALTSKLTRELLRYLRDEKTFGRNLFLAKKRIFEMEGELYKQGTDAICIDKSTRTIETIRYKTSAATGMTKGMDNVKPDEFRKLEKFYDLYADQQYVVQNATEIASWTSDGRAYTVLCNYYFLKKTTDKKDHFVVTFFDGGGNSVVGISEVHRVGEQKTETVLDNQFAKYIDQAVNVGFDCDKETCRFCNYKGLCNFTQANVKQDKKVVKATALGTPSPAQQAVIDIAWEGPNNKDAKYPISRSTQALALVKRSRWYISSLICSRKGIISTIFLLPALPMLVSTKSESVLPVWQRQKDLISNQKILSTIHLIVFTIRILHLITRDSGFP